MNRSRSRFKPAEADGEYQRLPYYADERSKQLAPMLRGYVDATDVYGRLMSRVCLIVGESKPFSGQDYAIRDLMADAFDFLFEARFFISKGQTLVAFPLARRAYEWISLLHWFVLDSKAAERWTDGKKFSNSDVRRALAAHPMGESGDALRSLYKMLDAPRDWDDWRTRYRK